MKVCPACSFSNEERYPTCVFCNALLVDVPSTPAIDPAHPEHERRALNKTRYKITHRQLLFAAALYALAITLTAVVPGLVFSPLVLLLYFGSSLIVVGAILRGIIGQFSSSFVQGMLSCLLLIYFGPQQPLAFFMIAVHVITPGVFWHWMELIHSANR